MIRAERIAELRVRAYADVRQATADVGAGGEPLTPDDLEAVETHYAPRNLDDEEREAWRRHALAGRAP